MKTMTKIATAIALTAAMAGTAAAELQRTPSTGLHNPNDFVDVRGYQIRPSYGTGGGYTISPNGGGRSINCRPSYGTGGGYNCY
jgi:hypothetical protein